MSPEAKTTLSGPLKGIRVADFSRVLAGSVGAMILGDLGADVIKIESLSGDLTRSWGPDMGGEGRIFIGWNRNKRGLAVDLKSKKGHKIAEDLVQKSDIVVENFRTGVAAKLKLDYDSLKKVRENIIYCSITGFGSRGPLATRPAFDPLLQALSGTARAAANSPEYDGEMPAYIYINSATFDYGAAYLGAVGILAALHHRNMTGEGQKIETSLLHAAMTSQSPAYVRPLDVEAGKVGGMYPNCFYRTSDDVIFVSVGTDKFWQLLCDALEASELAQDEKYKTMTGRVGNRKELHPLVQAYFLSKTTTEWERLLADKGIPCAPALTHAEFFDHPQVAALGMNPVVKHSKIGRLQVAGVGIELGKTPGKIHRTAPALGEHTEEVLREIGYSDRRIKTLKQAGIVHQGA